MSSPVARDHAQLTQTSSSDTVHSLRPRDLEKQQKEDDTDSDDYSYDDVRDHDGHRPTDHELRLAITRTRSRAQNGRNNMAITTTATRTQTALARLRSRPATHTFTHPLANQETTENVLVDFEGPDDPYRPINWPTRKKVWTTFLYALVTMTASWASSSYSAGTSQVAREFHVGNEVAVLGTTLFLFGFGLGPLLWAPLSEVYGRRLAVLCPMFVAMCFSFGSATAKDFQTLMLTRFFGAFFASVPVTNTGGVLGDLYTPAYRGIAMAGYAMAVVGGPCLGPIVSAAFVVQPQLGWRWTEYFTGILQGFILLIATILIDESYPPKLLIYKARRLRHETGNWALHAKFEEWDVSIVELSRKFLVRPIQILCTPICFAMALYASFCYGILYMQLGAIPIIFGEVRGWSLLVAELPFLSILIGCVLGAGINVVNQIFYNKAYHANGDRAVPERRLPPMMIGAVLFSGGQFMVGWTSSPSIPWIVPVIGLVLLSTGFFTIFQCALNYLVDTFTQYAASAVAANTFLRSCFAGGFPLAVGPLYHNIGVGPGTSITGGFAALLIPIPFVFWIYGRRLRGMSKWSKGSVY